MLLRIVVFRAIDGCGKVLEFYNGSGLFRLDLQTGELSDMVPDEKLATYAFSISPQDTKLIYAKEGTKLLTIKLKNVFSGQEKSITLDEKYDGAGNFAWFPNEDKVLFVATENVCEDNQIYSILTLDLSTLEVKTVIDLLDRNLSAIEWEAPDILRMSDWHGNTWILDIKLSQLILF